jgi:hypothetical protein
MMIWWETVCFSHQNLVLDAAILLRTVTAVIHGIGAV